LFHQQLRSLWKQRPLVEEEALLKERTGPSEYSLLRPRGPFVFVPLVSAEMDVVADLSVVLMRPEAPGALITQDGDMDNRLKTLFDALALPQANALPKATGPTSEEDLFFCLLEDDNLITSLQLHTEQLLEPGVDKNTVDLMIRVHTRVTRRTWGNNNFAAG
jgi:hypothetical protein